MPVVVGDPISGEDRLCRLDELLVAAGDVCRDLLRTQAGQVERCKPPGIAWSDDAVMRPVVPGLQGYPSLAVLRSPVACPRALTRLTCICL